MTTTPDQPTPAELAAQQSASTQAPEPPPLDMRRYVRVIWFFGNAFASFIWWELILRRIPGISGYARRTRTARWQRVAEHYRRLAIELGGVLIKLGQFLSIRVDVLPEVVTRELAGLQDEVPAELPEHMEAVIFEEFGRPSNQVFEHFQTRPEAAASLAQVHLARLPGGTDVVVKIQRPGIARIVETDLAAIAMAKNWLKLYGPIRRKADLDQIYDEFARTTRAEVDFVAEGNNAEHFARDFAGNDGVHIPAVHWDYSTRRILALENVAYIKIGDMAAIEAAGIDRGEVAKRLYQAYLEQIFVHNFVHADPHPGNLFVEPLPRPRDARPGDPTPFKLVFVDFGMVAVIPEQLRASLREFLIAIGTFDSHRVVQAYIDAGVLSPDADRKRIEELHDVMFRALKGVRMSDLSTVAFEQAEVMMREYRDLLFNMPVQFPSDMLFAARAVGILSGICTQLDPDFDPWGATIPFAEQISSGAGGLGLRGWISEAGDMARLLFRLPGRLESVLTDAQRGDLTVKAALAPDNARALRRIDQSINRVMWTVAAAGLFIGGVILRVAEGPNLLNTGLLISAAAAFLWGLTRR